MKKHFLFTVLFLLSTTLGFSRLVQVKDKADYPFWLSLPADSILNARPPVLIFLHGRSLSGSDLQLVTRYGIIKEIMRGRSIPGVVFAPQVKAGQAWNPEKILSVLNYVQSTYNTDSSRVYVAGMSLGGYGTLNFAGRYPEKVAAAVALCGGGNVSDACRLAQVPLWIQHGKLDKAVPISESEKVVNAIKACNGGANLDFKVYDNWGHGELERVFRTDEMYNWLFSKVNDRMGKKVE